MFYVVARKVAEAVKGVTDEGGQGGNIKSGQVKSRAPARGTKEAPSTPSLGKSTQGHQRGVPGRQHGHGSSLNVEGHEVGTCSV